MNFCYMFVCVQNFYLVCDLHCYEKSAWTQTKWKYMVIHLSYFIGSKWQLKYHRLELIYIINWNIFSCSNFYAYMLITYA